MVWLLFGVSLVLFFLILFPNLGHRVPFVGQWDYVLELQGTIYEEVNTASENATRPPLAAATVEIGGYRVSTSGEGAYRLRFVSRSLADIPVIISVGESTYIREVSFPSGQFTMKQDFVVP